MSETMDGKISNLEKLCTENCVEILKCIHPHYMSSQNFDTISRANLNFPSLDDIGDKVKKNPRMMFQSITEIEIQSGGFGFWLSLKSNQPSFRRQKLEYDELLNCIEYADLKSYTKELAKADEELFEYLQEKYGTRFDIITDQIYEFNLEEEEKRKEAAAAKKSKEEEEARAVAQAEEEARAEAEAFRKGLQQSWTSQEERMSLFPAIFDFSNQTVKTVAPPTSFVEGDQALAKFFPSTKFIIGDVVPGEPDYHLDDDHSVSILAKKNVRKFNEFQRLIAYLLQHPYSPGMPMSNLLICAEPFYGFKTVLAAKLFNLVTEYKELNDYGQAPSELRFNRNPYILIVAPEDVDCLPVYKELQSYIGRFQINMPNTCCTNVKLSRNLELGCDILLLDRKKIDFLRNGEIGLCNLRHVVFLNVEMFTGIRESTVSDVHEIIQKTIAREEYENPNSDKGIMNIQYIFQSYSQFTGWESYERLFHLTEPVSNNFGIILNAVYDNN